MKLNAIVCVGFGPGIRSLVLVCWLSADFSLGTEGGELAEFLFAFGRGSYKYQNNIKISSPQRAVWRLTVHLKSEVHLLCLAQRTSNTSTIQPTTCGARTESSTAPTPGPSTKINDEANERNNPLLKATGVLPFWQLDHAAGAPRLRDSQEGLKSLRRLEGAFDDIPLIARQMHSRLQEPINAFREASSSFCCCYNARVC